MNKDNILSLMDATSDDITFALELSDKIVSEKTEDLDDLMREIQDNIVNVDNPEDVFIERYLLQLTNMLYFITNRCESFGFYDDITKANVRLKYNTEYSKNQLQQAQSGKKATQAENQLAAELGSVDEQAVNIIYSRSTKIINSKISAANEMLRTLSKLLSVHMNTTNSTYFTRKQLE